MDRESWIVVAVVAALAALGVLAYHQYSRDSHDTSWLDPQQPPANVDSMVKLVPQTPRMMRSEPLAVEYPPSLMDWTGSVVGDH